MQLTEKVGNTTLNKYNFLQQSLKQNHVSALILDRWSGFNFHRNEIPFLWQSRLQVHSNPDLRESLMGV